MDNSRIRGITERPTLPARPMPQRKSGPPPIPPEVKAASLRRNLSSPPPEIEIIASEGSSIDVSALDKGELIAERYSLISLLGCGGCADVWLARDWDDNKLVAIKIDTLGSGHNLLEAEGAALQRLDGREGVVRLLGTGENYLVLEFIEGRQLLDLIADRPQFTSPDYPAYAAQILQIMAAVLACLDGAHQLVIHRDISPDNVMILNDGTIKIIDWGTARSVQDKPTETTCGKPQFISPEQRRNFRLDGRTDVYSAACMIYYMLIDWPFPDYYHNLSSEAEMAMVFSERINGRAFAISSGQKLGPYLPGNINSRLDLLLQNMTRYTEPGSCLKSAFVDPAAGRFTAAQAREEILAIIGLLEQNQRGQN
ncbi:serine/threonine protein kinase [Candidatus Saganbacteria bacterium]|nr:serine/threonine protein kinase [Candidatus Saganbacteria bacterium]